MRAPKSLTCSANAPAPQSGMLTHAEKAAAILFAHTAAVLLSDDHPYPMRYICAFDGSGLVCVADDPDILEINEAELHVPDESLELRDDAAIAMVTFARAPVESVSRVRWEAFHGEPPADRFATLKVHAVRISGEVFDESEIRLANPLASAQAPLCARANHPALATAVEAATGTTPGQARAVGVDPFGVHVRGAFVVHRLSFPERANDPDHASALIDALLGQDA